MNLYFCKNNLSFKKSVQICLEKTHDIQVLSMNYMEYLYTFLPSQLETIMNNTDLQQIKLYELQFSL